MSLYAWREVVSWIREVIGTDPDDGIEYLTDTQLAHLNAQLVDTAPADAWHDINIETEQIITEVRRLCDMDTGADSSGGRFTQGDRTARTKHQLKLRVGF